MIDLDALERIAEGNGKIQVSRAWLREVIKELRNNRETVDRLARERDFARVQKKTTTVREDFDFPTEEWDEGFAYFDKAFGAFSRVFSKIRRR